MFEQMTKIISYTTLQNLKDKLGTKLISIYKPYY